MNGSGILTMLTTLKELMEKINVKHLPAFTALAIVYGGVRSFGGSSAEMKEVSNRSNAETRFERKLFSMFLIGLFLSIALITMSSLSYPHYMLIGFPFLALMLGYCFAFFRDLFEVIGLRRRNVGLMLTVLLFLFAGFPSYAGIAGGVLRERDMFSIQDIQVIRLSDYMAANSSPDDTYFGYGLFAIPNMFSGPKSASRNFVAYTPYAIMYSQDPKFKITTKYFDELMGDIASAKPKWLMTTSGDFPQPLMDYINENNYAAVEYFKQGENFLLYERTE
jgi:hypothetical protein